MLDAGQCSIVHGVVKLVLIGDVHGLWDQALDNAALQFLKPDAAIFVGDFNEEDIPLVQQIASVQVPKAVMLGNHDAWTGLYFGYGPGKVNEQIDILESDYIGYGAKTFDNGTGQSFTVVGGRPFSDGNSTIPGLTAKKYKVRDMSQSAEKVRDLITQHPAEQPLVLVGHNGPQGLGSRRHDPCGKDFVRKGGDYGDADLEMAMHMLGRERRRKISLVTFGHMHQELQSHYMDKGKKELRNMVDIDRETGTVFLNCAVVPRHRRPNGELEAHFVEVILSAGTVTSARNLWISNHKDPRIVRSEDLIRTASMSAGSVTRSFFKAHDDLWEHDIRSPAGCDD